jgi:hypothetical protein
MQYAKCRFKKLFASLPYFYPKLANNFLTGKRIKTCAAMNHLIVLTFSASLPPPHAQPMTTL